MLPYLSTGFYPLIVTGKFNRKQTFMWYFLIRHDTIEPAQYRELQQLVSLTEVELFNEPYGNWYVFTVEQSEYTTFMDHLDREGIHYELTADRPSRDELLERMR